ncbi:PQQ-binding-like beta-propeller repeat protein [Antribacter sp. KLBMP9083]|uniref:PQQ-binding-like beta-propeller repeat protein n=1 Tax=Antribacter soli TaxID=2910976 RepID=A0AA41QBV5_9MICO|nr:PQQ-binding-like beta-propeller repeat protein [Antribacter soli]MCF4120589.1 PQQ-binding-like beta-propeller repeat protein [Antribacter soli]
MTSPRDTDRVHSFDLVEEDGSDSPDGTGSSLAPDGASVPDAPAAPGTDDGMIVGVPEFGEKSADDQGEAVQRAERPASGSGFLAGAGERVSGALATVRDRAATGARAGATAVRDRIPRSRRGRALLAAGTAAVLVAGAAGGVAIDRLVDAAHLRAAPGGVTTLALEPAQRWSVEVTSPLSAHLVRMPGVVGVVTTDRVLGLDPATGAERWSVPLGANASCGPLPAVRSEAALVLDELVCISSDEATEASDGAPDPESERTVTVVDADGTTQERTLEPGATAVPAADGGLFVVERTGDAPDEAAAMAGLEIVRDAEGNEISLGGTLQDGWDLEVRLEDAATGETRWERGLPFVPVDASFCVTWADREPELDLDGPISAVATPSALAVGACGVQGVFTPEGDPVETLGELTSAGWEPSPADQASLQVFVQDGVPNVQHGLGSLPGTRYPLAGGGYARLDGLVVTPDGERVRTDGTVLDPFTTDGGDGPLLVQRDGALVALDIDGTTLWTSELVAYGVLARTADLAVVAGVRGALQGVDLASGEVVWSADPELLVPGITWTGLDALVFAAFTDGDTLLLAVNDDPTDAANINAQPGEATAPVTSGLRLLALDLDSGEVRWEQRQETPYTQLLSVDGHLVQITEQGIAGLG